MTLKNEIKDRLLYRKEVIVFGKKNAVRSFCEFLGVGCYSQIHQEIDKKRSCFFLSKSFMVVKKFLEEVSFSVIEDFGNWVDVDRIIGIKINTRIQSENEGSFKIHIIEFERSLKEGVNSQIRELGL